MGKHVWTHKNMMNMLYALGFQPYGTPSMSYQGLNGKNKRWLMHERIAFMQPGYVLYKLTTFTGPKITDQRNTVEDVAYKVVNTHNCAYTMEKFSYTAAGRRGLYAHMLREMEINDRVSRL